MATLREYLQAHPNIVLKTSEYGTISGAQLERDCHARFMDHAPIQVHRLLSDKDTIGIDHGSYVSWWTQVRDQSKEAVAPKA